MGKSYGLFLKSQLELYKKGGSMIVFMAIIKVETIIRLSSEAWILL